MSEAEQSLRSKCIQLKNLSRLYTVALCSLDQMSKVSQNVLRNKSISYTWHDAQKVYWWREKEMWGVGKTIPRSFTAHIETLCQTVYFNCENIVFYLRGDMCDPFSAANWHILDCFPIFAIKWTLFGTTNAFISSLDISW